MNDFPCRVSADLRRYEREQEENERDWERSRGLRMEAAIEAIADPVELKKILNDEDLAGSLSQIMYDFDASMEEINNLVLQGHILTLANLMRNVSRLRSQLIEMHMGE